MSTNIESILQNIDLIYKRKKTLELISRQIEEEKLDLLYKDNMETKNQKLEIKDYNIKELLPGLGKLIHLKELIITQTQLETLPQEIGNLTNLTGLDLEKNKLTTLPKEIGNLTNLTKLNLSTNRQLRILPKEIGNLTNLTELYLDRTAIFSLQSIENLTNLTDLHLGFNGSVDLEKTRKLINLKLLEVNRGVDNATLPTNIKELPNIQIRQIGS